MADHSNSVQPPHIIDPPVRLGGILMRLGPGMIIAGSIVGSGELIATTKVGAEAGFVLLWLILLGCAVKVFTQIELGRHSVAWSETTLRSLNRVPGPRLRVNWVVWFWAVMTLLIVSQQGGIVGGIGQALAIPFPLTEDGRQQNEERRTLIQAQIARALGDRAEGDPIPPAELEATINRLEEKFKNAVPSHDPLIWAALLTVPTSLLMLIGRYRLVQVVATVLVGSFTLVTIVTLVLLQLQPNWAVSAADVWSGLQFRLPDQDAGSRFQPIATALAAFGLIGVGAGELFAYPYWCLEKGYAKATGPYDGSQAWIERARGWMRVMYFDAWLSMIVYTLATVVFFLLGAAVLWRTGLNPEKQRLVATLTEMYVPVFGEWAPAVFLFGAIAVLYSTFFVAACGFGRMISDALGIMGLASDEEQARLRRARWVSAGWVWIAVILFGSIRDPVGMVLASGIAQSMMLPVLGCSALWFRYRHSNPRLLPGRWFDAGLWISTLGFFITAGWILTDKIVLPLWASLNSGNPTL